MIILTVIAGILFFVKSVDQAGINNIFLFVGIQMPIVFTYLFGNKSLENKNENKEVK